MTQVIKHDDYDKLTFREITDQSEEIRKHQATEDQKSLSFDIFNTFYKMEPEVDQEGPSPQRGMMESLMNLREYADLREYTQLDEVSSALATCEMAGPYMEQLAKFQEAEEEARKQGQELSDQKRQELEEGFRVAAREACRNGQEKAEEAADAMAALAGTDQGSLKQLPVGKRMELAKKLANNDKFKRIAKLLGRFKNLVNAAVEQNPTHGYDEIVDITTGSALQRVIPSELMKLRTQPAVFMKDMLEGNLLQYNLRGEEPKAAGPIICCLDVSGSMSGERDEWGKAVLLALLHLAEKQKRGFAAIFYDSGVSRVDVFEPGEVVGPERRLKLASFFSGGGTSYEAPIRMAFSIREAQPSLKPADIVFITDGAANLGSDQQEEIRRMKRETSVRFHTLGIFAMNEAALGPISDSCVLINNLGDVSYVQDLVKGTASMFGAE